MLSSIRRLISYPDPVTRADPADVALFIKNLVDALEIDVLYDQGTLAARPVSTVGTPGIAGRIYVATDQTPHQMYWDYGTGWDSMGTPTAGTITYAMLAAALKPSGGAAPGTESLRALGTTADTAAAGIHAVQHLPGGVDPVSLNTYGTLAARPAPSNSLNGVTYWATDQAALYLCVAAAWIRIGEQAGDTIWTMESTARTGYIMPVGQAWPSTTGIYADLFAKWGGLYPTTLPDFQGREFIAKGTHADINTIGFNEGVAVAARRPKHKHAFAGSAGNTGTDSVDHTHSNVIVPSVVGGTANTAAGPTSGSTSGVSSFHTHGFTPAGTVGPQTGNEPTDSPAYLVLQPQVKL